MEGNENTETKNNWLGRKMSGNEKQVFLVKLFLMPTIWLEMVQCSQRIALINTGSTICELQIAPQRGYLKYDQS